MKTYLLVPYQDKDTAKALGARFNMSLRQWYVPDGVDNAPFKRWFVADQLSFEWRKKLALGTHKAKTVDTKEGRWIVGKDYRPSSRVYDHPPWEDGP